MQKVIQYILLLIIVLDLLAIGFWVYLTLGSLKAANPSSTATKVLEIEKGLGAKDIARRLKQEGVIANDLFFNYYIWRTRSTNLLRAGKYELSPAMTIPDIVRVLKKGEATLTTDEEKGIKVTIPEGFSSKEVEATLIKAGLNIKQGELLEAVKVPIPVAYEIFGFETMRKDLPSRATLDGFLFPDTYFFDPQDGVHEVIKKMFGNFDSKITDLLRVKYKARGKDLYEVAIMASLLEKEVRTQEDMRFVSGVLWKRMEIGMPLQVDATLAYITGKKTGEITNDDKLIDSPYNTYLYRGLPPAPIANPGLQAIRAAADPMDSDYLYYLSTPEGQTVFSKTLDEHNANKTRYLR